MSAPAAAAAAAAAGGEEGEVRGVTLIFRAFDLGGLARAPALVRVRGDERLLCALDVLLDDFALRLGRLQAVKPQACLKASSKLP